MLKKITFLALTTSTLFAKEQKILLFSGSTRTDSLNKKLIAEAVQFIPAKKATVIDLKEYTSPFYDGDLEAKQGMPPKAQKLRKLMIESDIIVISTPEYNGSISSILKNALDWCSRCPEGGPSREAFQGKTFVLLSASPSPAGGSRAIKNLETIVQNVGGTVYVEQFSLPKADNAFNSEGKLKNPETREKLQKIISNATKAIKA